MVDRLADDHARTAVLAQAVAERWPGAPARPAPTNVEVWEPPGAEAVLAHLAGEGGLAGTIAPGVVRLVTHHDVDDAGIERAARALRAAP